MMQKGFITWTSESKPTGRKYRVQIEGSRVVKLEAKQLCGTPRRWQWVELEVSAETLIGETPCGTGAKALVDLLQILSLGLLSSKSAGFDRTYHAPRVEVHNRRGVGK